MRHWWAETVRPALDIDTQDIAAHQDRDLLQDSGKVRSAMAADAHVSVDYWKTLLPATLTPSSVREDLDGLCENFCSALNQDLGVCCDPFSCSLNQEFDFNSVSGAEREPLTTQRSELLCLASDDKIPDYDPLGKAREALIEDALCLFRRWDLISLLRIPLSALKQFLHSVADKMPDNEYHSFAHAVDVACYSQALAELTGLVQEMPDHLKLAFLLGALCHDLKHPGHGTRLYAVEQGLEGEETAGCLEAMHLREAEKLLYEETPVIQGRTDLGQREEIKKCVSMLILSTDMEAHQYWLDRLDQWSAGTWDPCVPEKMSLLLKLADISNLFRGEQLCLKWSERISSEFFAEGDALKELGIPLLPHMDRQSRSVADNTLGFLDYVVVPYMTRMKKCFKGLLALEKNMEKNRSMMASLTVRKC